jgi:hypothetical protein
MTADDEMEDDEDVEDEDVVAEEEEEADSELLLLLSLLAWILFFCQLQSSLDKCSFELLCGGQVVCVPQGFATSRYGCRVGISVCDFRYSGGGFLVRRGA